MKRFVDLRDADIESTFAWYDTIVDKFETYNGTMSWNTFSEFADDYDGDELDRYKGLCPEWVKEPIKKPYYAKIKLPGGTDIHINEQDDDMVSFDVAGEVVSTEFKLERKDVELLFAMLDKLLHPLCV